MPFEARPLPTAIFLGDECVAGPFCKHCGYPLSLHSPEHLLCPAFANGLMGPSCECHEIRKEEVTRWVVDDRTVRRTKRDHPYRRRVTQKADRIVRIKR